jgi:hypothetical protein
VLAATQDSGLVLGMRLRLFSDITSRKRESRRSALLVTAFVIFTPYIRFFSAHGKLNASEVLCVENYSRIALACLHSL